MKSKEIVQAETALAVWLAIQTKVFTTKGRALKSTVSELLKMQESHLKVNSICFFAVANSVMTESWKDLVSMTSVSNCASMDIRPKSESLSCSILFWENGLIRFKEENDLSTGLSLPAATIAFLSSKVFWVKEHPSKLYATNYIAVVTYFDEF